MRPEKKAVAQPRYDQRLALPRTTQPGARDGGGRLHEAANAMVTLERDVVLELGIGAARAEAGHGDIVLLQVIATRFGPSLYSMLTRNVSRNTRKSHVAHDGGNIQDAAATL